MKKLFIIITACLISGQFYSQDLIVTNEGDSVNCKITKVKHDHIFFIYSNNEEVRQTLLPFTKVAKFQQKYFETSKISDEVIKALSPDYQRIRIGISGGYSYRTDEINSGLTTEQKEFTKGLKSGGHIFGDLTGYFNEYIGLGLKLGMFKSSNSVDKINYGNGYSGSLTEEVKIFFVAPMFSCRLLNHSKKNAFLLNYSLGYMGLKDNGTFKNTTIFTSGNTLGMSFDMGFDIGLSEKFSLGFQISFLRGVLTKMKVSDGINSKIINLGKNEYEGLSRVDFSVGLRINN